MGVPKPVEPEKKIILLKNEGVAISVKPLVRFRELKEKATHYGGGILSLAEVQEAISIAEDIITKVQETYESAGPKPESGAASRVASKKSKADFRFGSRHTKTTGSSRFDSADLTALSYARSEDTGHVDTEFVTKLLLARAILTYRKKRIPRFIGVPLIVISMAACLVLTAVGGSGIMLMFSGRAIFSLIPLVFDFVFLLIAYFFLKVTLSIRRETS
jgi:hypothetical protein